MRTNFYTTALQEVGVGVLAPAAELAANPLPNAIAVVSLRDVAKGDVKMPEGAGERAREGA